MKKFLFLVSILIFTISCSSSSSNNEDENSIAVPSYMKGCKYNDNDYENYSGEYSYLKCFYKEEDGIIKMIIYEGGYGPVGNIVDSYIINFNTANITGGGFNYTIISNGKEFKFTHNNDPLDQNEPGFYQRVSVRVDNHIIHFKPSNCSFVNQYITN